MTNCLQKILKFNLVGFITGPAQPAIGWFKKEVKSVGDLKNIQVPHAGLPLR